MTRQARAPPTNPALIPRPKLTTREVEMQARTKILEDLQRAEMLVRALAARDLHLRLMIRLQTKPRTVSILTPATSYYNYFINVKYTYIQFYFKKIFKYMIKLTKNN